MTIKYQLKTIQLDDIEFNPRQPRSDAELTDLESLGASFGDNPDAPNLAQLPVVYPLADGRYRVQMGERRIRALQQRAATKLQVLVLDSGMSVIDRHRLSLLENLHRAELGVIDEAVGLKVAYFYENALALGLQPDADTIMESAADSFGVMQSLQVLLEQNGWKRTNPTVDWQACLAKLGLTLNKQALMRRLYVLNLDTGVIERIQALGGSGTLELSEASIRVIGKLEVDDQICLLDAIAATPEIANKIRRITSKVEDGIYTIKEAIAESRGEVYLGDEEDLSDAPLTIPPVIGRSLNSVVDDQDEVEAHLPPAMSDIKLADGHGKDSPQDWNETEITPQKPSPVLSAPILHKETSILSDEALGLSVEVGDQVLEAVNLLGQLDDTLKEIQRIVGTELLDDLWGPVLDDSIKSVLPLLQRFARSL